MSEGGAVMAQAQQRTADWAALAEAAFSEVTAWRQRHPKATLREVETTIDERLAKLRAQMLQDTALASAAADLAGVAVEERPVCPDCGQRLQPRGQQVRHLTTAHEQPVVLRRSYATCPACGAGLFPPG
jgi:NADH pyrophosphatase NudC (nudix superfamily)